MNKLALIIGHSEKSQGAVNKDSGVTEWEWNSKFVDDIWDGLFDEWGWVHGKPHVEVFHRTHGIKELVNRINEWNPDLAIEFHCNSYKEKWIERLMRFEKEAEGTEMLLSKFYSRGNSIFANEVDCLSHSVAAAADIIPRGVKFRGRFGRGGRFLNTTNCKAIIAETFFIDNNSDLQKADDNYDALVKCYVDWIANYFKEV